MSKKILLADDSITIQKVIELTFSDEDFEVVTVGNGRLALEKLPEVQPDVVLCDIIMPEKDGYEVCERIKQSGTFSHVPVLLLTGAFEPFDQERAAQVGSDGFLAKPFEPETLIAKVKDLLSRAPAPSAESGAATVAPVAARAPSAAPFEPAAPPEFEPAAPTFQPAPPAPEPPPPPAFEPAQPAPEPPPPPTFEPAQPAFEPAEPAPEPPSPPTFEPAQPAFEPAEPAPEPPPPPASEPGPITEAFDESPTVSDEPGLGPSFIPEEPYETFEEATFESASERTQEPELLAPVTPAESATLSGAPSGEKGAADESTSTVMFDASEVTWGTEGASPAEETGPSATAPRAEAAPGDEPTLTPEPIDSPDPGHEPEAFEEVLEADLDDPGSDWSAPEVSSPPDEPHAELEVPPTLKTAVPSPLREGGGDEPFLSDEPRPQPEDQPYQPQLEDVPYEPQLEAEPEPAPEPEPEAEPAPELEAPQERGAPAQPETIPPVPPQEAGVEGERTLPGATRADVVESFADMETGGETEEPASTAASEAASVSVPVDMVEKIAQRVVAQVSEKVVREIVWEVVPDLAEALIKREIDRLKAELDEL